MKGGGFKLSFIMQGLPSEPFERFPKLVQQFEKLASFLHPNKILDN